MMLNRYFCMLVVLIAPLSLSAQDRDSNYTPVQPMGFGMPMEKNDPEGVGYFERLIKAGFSEELCLELGDFFSIDGRPFQSRFFYEQALSLNADSEKAKAGIEEANERLKYLDERFKQFSEQAEKENVSGPYCSMAAIRFHLGFPRKALSIIMDGKKKLGQDFQLIGMYDMFLGNMRGEHAKLKELGLEVTRNVADKNREEAILNVSRMYYFGLGVELAEKSLVEIRDAFPDWVKEDTVTRLAEMKELLREKVLM